jgi:hypothetical protein
VFQQVVLVCARGMVDLCRRGARRSGIPWRLHRYSLPWALFVGGWLLSLLFARTHRVPLSFGFGPSGFGRPLLPYYDLGWLLQVQRRLPTTVTKLLGVPCRPPQIRTSSFRSCTRPSLLPQLLAALDFVMPSWLVRLKQPQIGFVYLRSSVCLRLPSDSASRRTPLPLANGRRSPAPARDFHPIDDAHAGRTR